MNQGEDFRENENNRRRRVRLPVHLPCRLENEECEIRDISYAGLRFQSKTLLEPETSKALILPITRRNGEKKDLEIEVIIRWCKESPNGGYEVGAEVSAISQEDEAEFIAFLFQKLASAFENKQGEIIELEDYRSLVEMAADPILVLYGGEINFANQAATEMFGYTSEELKGFKFDSLILSEPDATVPSPHSPSPSGDSSDPNYYILRNSTGKSVHVEIRSRPILYRHRVATLSILRDLTERKQIEQKLLQVERLKVLGELAAGIAHDVNNSLLLILGSVEHIEGETDINVIAEAHRTIKTATLDGAATIQRIQDLGRLKDEADFVLLDLNEIVSDAKNITRPKWEEEPKGRVLSIEVSKNLAEEAVIQGNASDLRQALVNLIINAVDAMPQGGEIELRTEVKGETVSLFVQDSGMGVPPEIKEKIFDPFFSTKGERGSGLGLSTVFGIMTKHRGSVTLESDEGRGTVVHLEFPLAREAKPPKLKDQSLKQIAGSPE